MDPILSKATDLHLAMDDSSVLQAAKDLFLFASTSREDASFSIKPTEHMTKIPSSLALPNEIDTISTAVATNSGHSKNETDTGMVDGALSHKKKYLPHEPFPVTLMRMVNDESINNIITFLPHGQSFVILDREQLMSDVLPVYFPATTSKVFASFSRKLNRWGFKLERGGAYFHQLFQRDSPENCREIHIKPKARKRNNGESITTQDFAAVRTNENSSSVRVSPSPSVISVTKCSHEEDPNTKSKNNVDSSKAVCRSDLHPGKAASEHYQKKEGEHLQKNAFIPFHGCYGPAPMMYRDPYYFTHCMHGKHYANIPNKHRAPNSSSEEKDVDEEKNPGTSVSPMVITSEAEEEAKAATSTVNKENTSELPVKDDSSSIIEVNGDSIGSNDAKPSSNAENDEVVTSNHNATASTPKRDGSKIDDTNCSEGEVNSSSQNVVTPMNTSVEAKDESDTEMVSSIIRT